MNDHDQDVPRSSFASMLPLQIAGPSRESANLSPTVSLTGLTSVNSNTYKLPDIEGFRTLLDDPNVDTKDLNHQLVKMMGAVALILIQESVVKAPSFHRAQTGTRAVEALRALAMTLQEREKNLYKDRLDFDNPRFQYFVDALWDVIEETMKSAGFTQDMIDNFFLMLQSKLPSWEEKTLKTCNAVGFNSARHGVGADRSEDATLINAKREKTKMPKAPTPDDHA